MQFRCHLRGRANPQSHEKLVKMKQTTGLVENQLTRKLRPLLTQTRAQQGVGSERDRGRKGKNARSSQFDLEGLVELSGEGVRR